MPPLSNEVRASSAADWVFAVCLQIWGDADVVRAFLQRPHALLEGARPVDLMSAGEPGAKRVLALLGRGMYGSAI